MIIKYINVGYHGCSVAMAHQCLIMSAVKDSKPLGQYSYRVRLKLYPHHLHNSGLGLTPVMIVEDNFMASSTTTRKSFKGSTCVQLFCKDECPRHCQTSHILHKLTYHQTPTVHSEQQYGICCHTSTGKC